MSLKAVTLFEVFKMINRVDDVLVVAKASHKNFSSGGFYIMSVNTVFQIELLHFA